MRLSRLFLAGLLLAAPVAPWLLAPRPAVMKCCPLGKRAACCPLSSCSIGRCAPPESLAFAAVTPGVLPARVAEVASPAAGRRSIQGRPSLRSLASDLQDPPPRA